MKYFKLLILMLSGLLMNACVENDFIADLIEERIAINNPVTELELNSTYQFEVTFFNNIGQPEEVQYEWMSTSPEVATVAPSGLVTAVAEGTTTLIVSTTLPNERVVTEDIVITVSSDPVVVQPITKSGVIVTTSSYLLQGDFTISEIEDSDDLDLQIAGNYQASTSLPGLYLYLTNNPNSINGALELGPVEVFNGAHSYLIENTGINDYTYLLYWCKPFTVKVGEGEIID